MAKAKIDKLDKRFCIHIHTRSKRLTDPDGISAKAAIDGLAKGGIFADDSARFIKSVSFSQEVTKDDEETIIDITLEE
jgi:hypothetical protein